MRLIDADALRADYFVTSTTTNTPLYRYVSMEQIANAPTVEPASTWHRVEDGLPEPHKDVLVTGMEAINNSRVYKVMVNDNGTWRPTDYAPSIRWDYWMPIEPPKEENK